MSEVRVQAAGQEALDRAQRLLAGFEGGLEKALRGAMSRSVSYMRANTAKAIQERYAISTANIRANENVHVWYRRQNGVQAVVTFAGRKIPLYRYDGTSPKVPTPDTGAWVRVELEERKWRMVHPSVPAYAHQLKGTAPAMFQNAFVAEMKSGHIGIFERTGGSTARGGDEIREIMGSSVPQMLGSETVAHSLAKQTMQKFEERLDHEITAILNGWR